ncbi:hypothetical protein [Desulfosediminicola ganghwensis]|uniref:hypothetical protein n=1 Tax=Desulfosediminicola ganghwensis TaxID=2569540 RepID=UPI0010ACFAC6|nr:hypothetical protein [Desulfosediminicola ganghwensis]
MEFLSKYFIPILLCTLSLASGMFIGHKIGRGESICLWRSTNGTTDIILGPASITNFDLNKLSDSDAAALFINIKSLSKDHFVAKSLNELCDCNEAFFENEEVQLTVKFHEEDGLISGDNGAACMNSTPYKKRISVTKIIDNTNESDGLYYMKEFFIIHTMSGEKCRQENAEATIWISNEAARKWLPEQQFEELPSEVWVEAQIMATL